MEVKSLGSILSNRKHVTSKRHLAASELIFLSEVFGTESYINNYANYMQ